MSSARRDGGVLSLVVLLTLAGSAGYMAIEGMSFIDALYMTVITITTVGYAEVKPLDTGGRLFTIVIIFIGVRPPTTFLQRAPKGLLEASSGNSWGRAR